MLYGRFGLPHFVSLCYLCSVHVICSLVPSLIRQLHLLNAIHIKYEEMQRCTSGALVQREVYPLPFCLFLQLWDLRKCADSILTAKYNGAILDLHANRAFCVVRKMYHISCTC